MMKTSDARHPFNKPHLEGNPPITYKVNAHAVDVRRRIEMYHEKKKLQQNEEFSY